MPPPERPRLPTGVPGLQWLTTDDGSRTLWSEGVGETFHSGCGAVAESLVVYVGHSGVAERLKTGQPTAVLEFGFGTATAFLLTAALAENYQTPLRYVGLEHRPLPVELLRSLHVNNLLDRAQQFCQSHPLCFPSQALQPLEEVLQTFLQALQTPTPSWITLSEWVQLRLVVGDARDFDPRVAEQHQPFNAVYFDPFSPESTPELWTENVFRQAFAVLQPGGTLTSYCVKSSIRRLLATAGFEVDKLPGPAAGKREVLRARKPI